MPQLIENEDMVVALLIGHKIKMGLPEVLDNHIPRHGK